MFSSAQLRWHSLIASVDTTNADNRISQRSVNRLRLASVPDDSWENIDGFGFVKPGAAMESVIATFRVSGAQRSHECRFYIDNTATFDVCFGSTFWAEYKDEYPELFGVMHTSQIETAHHYVPTLYTDHVSQTETGHDYDPNLYTGHISQIETGHDYDPSLYDKD
jgi:hypothetical protein